MAAPNIETIVSLSKRRGFVYPSSDIYGGLGSAWDYGPLGIELYNNVKQAWWRWMVYDRDDIEGLDSSIILNRLVWKYSGHEDTFSDPLVDCRECNNRMRADKLDLPEGAGTIDRWRSFVRRVSSVPTVVKPILTEPRPFNLMFRTHVGATAEDDPSALVYLRPETAQGIFINFLNVLTTSRRKLPFGIAQIGKSFRNEVTPGNFIFRTREFEQMEMEYFVRPGEKTSRLIRNGSMPAITGSRRWASRLTTCVFTSSQKKNWPTMPSARSTFSIASFPSAKTKRSNGTN